MVRPTYDIPKDTLYFSPASPEAQFLCAQDDDMAELIGRIGEVHVDIEADGFISLARAICDQQISIYAARAIWGRFSERCGGLVTPEAVSLLEVGEMRACGFSERKVSYIKDLAEKTVAGVLDFETMPERDDQSIIDELMQVKGIGRWTAEMFLIFALKRPDVFALDDGGLRRAVCALKGLESNAPKALIEAVSEQWAPQRTCASLYLWRSLDNTPME